MDKRKHILLVASVLAFLGCNDAREDVANGPAEPAGVLAGNGNGDAKQAGTEAVIQVPPPTGVPETDRANIDAAIGSSAPGDIIQFAPGTYVIGVEPFFIEVGVDDLTLLGHPAGTTIRGGPVVDFDTGPFGLLLTAARVKVRGLTLESFVIALAAGFPDPTSGPYLIEQNVFKNSFEGVELALNSPHPSQVRSNQFIDVARPFFMFGGTAHFRHNATTNPRPQDIPLTGQPIQAGVIVTSPGEPCEDNLVAGNRVDGASDGFFLVADGLDAECRSAVIRDNVFTNQTIYAPGDTGTLAFLAAVDGGIVSGTLLQDNSLEGTNGIGMFVSGVMHSKFVGNTIANVRKGADLEPPLAPGGIGILLLGGSFGNEVRANDFPHVESCAVVLREATHDNQVVEPEDRVLDQGTDNQVVGKPCHESPLASAAGAAADLRSNPKFSQLLDLATRHAGR